MACSNSLLGVKLHISYWYKLHHQRLPLPSTDKVIHQFLSSSENRQASQPTINRRDKNTISSAEVIIISLQRLGCRQTNTQTDRQTQIEGEKVAAMLPCARACLRACMWAINTGIDLRSAPLPLPSPSFPSLPPVNNRSQNGHVVRCMLPSAVN